MQGISKGTGAFSVSALAIGSILFAPVASAYISTDAERPAAASREQAQIQLQLAEKTRNLADQYTNRRFGTEENPIVEEPAPVPEPAPVEEEFDRANRGREQRERYTSTAPSSADVRTAPLAQVAEMRTEPVAEHLPNLPSSGLGLSAAALALGITGALKGRKKFERARS